MNDIHLSNKHKKGSSMYDYTVFIGRMQPPHIGHIKTIQKALELSDNVIIILGSANKPSDIKNPWSWIHRQQMIRSCFNEQENKKIIIQPVEDRLYNNMYWIQMVQQSVDITIRSKNHNLSETKVALIGHHKDESSWYLDNFPTWKQIEMPNIKNINATDIRKDYFGNMNYCIQFDDRLPKTVIKNLIEFQDSEKFDLLLEEKSFLEKHDEMWSKAPYTPTFNTTDAVVFRSGHILLIERRNTPGKGLLALPGGYLNPEEAALDGAIRELIEETKLKGPGSEMLKDKVFADRVFDHPQRSLRGRIITKAYFFNLGQGKLLKVKGADDAAKANWYSLNEIAGMRHRIFEDHADIIEYGISKFPC